MQIQRTLENQIIQSLFKWKTIVLYGPRQVGKTTLLKKIMEQYPQETLYFNCDLLKNQELFSKQDDTVFADSIWSAKIIILDEAQKVKNIGLNLKILHDTFPDRQFIASGSSSFELSQGIHEPMTWRIKRFTLYPLSYQELRENKPSRLFLESLSNTLVYGTYPDILATAHKAEKKDRIETLTNLYVFKDVLALDGIKKSEVIVKLLKLLAFQIWQLVWTQELAQQLNVSIPTVQKYITILEESFIIFRLWSFSKNLRKELSKSMKIYFWDTGVRNSLLEDYTPLETRTDKGYLRENRCISELLKQKAYARASWSLYFRRTYDSQEIDCVYSSGNKVPMLWREIKRTKPSKRKIPHAFSINYPDSPIAVLTPDSCKQIFASFVSSQLP